MSVPSSATGRVEELEIQYAGVSLRGETRLRRRRLVVAGRARRGGVVLVCFLAGLCGGSTAVAQDLTPRFYWPSPKGTKVGVVGYVYATGDVLFDPSIPLYGVDSDVNIAVLGYLQTFSLWGRTTNVVVELPYQWSTTQGILVDTPARGNAFGIGDLGVTLAVNLLGAPTMTPADFQALRQAPHPILGASLKVIAPTGQYNPDRLLNVGGNRWALRAELGAVIPLKRRWLLELQAGTWFLGDDPDFIAGYREQEPIFAFQAHLVRRLRPGFWASLDANYFAGGRQTIGGNELVDVQQNSRVGGTVAFPFASRYAVKFGFATGIFTEFGSDFDQYLVSFQMLLNRMKRRPE